MKVLDKMASPVQVSPLKLGHYSFFLGIAYGAKLKLPETSGRRGKEESS